MQKINKARTRKVDGVEERPELHVPDRNFFKLLHPHRWAKRPEALFENGDGREEGPILFCFVVGLVVVVGVSCRGRGLEGEARAAHSDQIDMGKANHTQHNTTQHNHNHNTRGMGAHAPIGDRSVDGQRDEELEQDDPQALARGDALHQIVILRGHHAVCCWDVCAERQTSEIPCA